MQTIDALRCKETGLAHEAATVRLDTTGRTRCADNAAAATFESHRPRLLKVAYRMLANRADAEDVVQDAYLRWHDAAVNDVESPLGYLISVTTRLCLDRLRQEKREREQEAPPWVPQPMVDDHVHSPERQGEIAEEVSVAFFAVVERLAPDERAVFLLREVFDYDYAEVAKTLGKTESGCRQVIHRARSRVRDPRARCSVTAESRQRLLEKFLVAAHTGDRNAVMALLAEIAKYTADASTAVENSPHRSASRQEKTMNSRKSIPRVPVAMFSLSKQRDVDTFGPVPLFASMVYGDDFRSPVDRRGSLNDRATRPGYVCAGRKQVHGEHAARGVYEIDHETYQTMKIG
jgi:RNA polymerase sigma-70 factor (ECF subfamily)